MIFVKNQEDITVSVSKYCTFILLQLFNKAHYYGNLKFLYLDFYPQNSKNYFIAQNCDLFLFSKF